MERGEIFPSLTVDVNSPTPYTDATQVRIALSISKLIYIKSIRYNQGFESKSTCLVDVLSTMICVSLAEVEKQPIRSRSTIVPNIPTIVRQFFFRHDLQIMHLWFAFEQNKWDRFTHDFSDEEADALPHQAADERVHGVEPDREAQDHRGDPGDAQRRDFKGSWETLETSLSSKKS